MVVKPTGRVESWVGIRSTGAWGRLWYMPNDQCEGFVRVAAADVGMVGRSPAGFHLWIFIHDNQILTCSNQKKDEFLSED